MSNRCIVLLNYSRSPESVQWFFDLYDKCEEFEINDTSFMYVSKDRETEHCDVNLQLGECNIASARNTIINECIKRGYTNLHIIDDDIEITNTSIFETYENLSKLMGNPYINNGYTTSVNITLNKPNPRMAFHLGEYGLQYDILDVVFNAQLSNGYAYYDLCIIGDVRYDEHVIGVTDNEYVIRLQKLGHLPFLNFFVDIPESYKYIKRISHSSNRLTNKIIESDTKYFEDNNIKWVPFNSVDTVIQHYVKKLK